MAAKKKNAETVETTASNVIAVDTRKLSQGLKMTFEGMALVFDSIGVDVAVPTVKADDVKTEVKADTASAEKAGGVEETKLEEHNVAPDAEVQNTATKAETEDAAEAQSEAQPDASELVSTVSLDDITKIIVQKIKQNRSNNEKIGSILKTYGVAKVGELPVSKYEAFLTDLSAI